MIKSRKFAVVFWSQTYHSIDLSTLFYPPINASNLFLSETKISCNEFHSNSCRKTKKKREIASICLTSRRSLLVKPREPKTRFRNGKFSYYLSFFVTVAKKRISLALALHLHLPFNTAAGQAIKVQFLWHKNHSFKIVAKLLKRAWKTELVPPLWSWSKFIYYSLCVKF